MIPSAEYDLIDSIGTSGFLIRLLSVWGNCCLNYVVFWLVRDLYHYM